MSYDKYSHDNFKLHLMPGNKNRFYKMRSIELVFRIETNIKLNLYYKPSKKDNEYSSYIEQKKMKEKEIHFI
jgi:hypothetical protein